MLARNPLAVGSTLVALGALLAAPAQSLYVYVPNMLVISTAEEADEWLTTMSIEFGVDGADDPSLADRPDLNRVLKMERTFTKFWESLDAVCDPNAVFALMYLTTTNGIVNHTEQGFFADNEYLSVITVVFAKLYFDAYTHYNHGHRDHVQKGWLEAFDYATSKKGTIQEDEFLGMNAHINYDLSVAIVALGITAPDGTSRKPDMDRVNHVLHDMADDVAYKIALFYGPTPPSSQPNWEHNDESYDPATEGVFQVIYDWREAAWHNAELLQAADGVDARALVDAEMQTHAWMEAQPWKTDKLEDPWPARLAYCQANP